MEQVEKANASTWPASERGALRADFARYVQIAGTNHGRLRAVLSALGEFGFLAICVYRYGRWTRQLRPRWLALPFKLIYRIGHVAVRVLFGIDLSTNSVIGPGFYIGHSGGIHIHADLGAYCSVAQGVTIGGRGGGRTDGYPKLGDRVYLGAGSMVVGSVVVGNGVIVGANTVVVEDIPDGCRVVSARARVLPPR